MPSLGAVRSVALLGNGKARRVQLQAKRGTLHFITENPEFGTAADEIEATYEGPGMGRVL